MGAGRPTTYTPETADAICAGIASGKLLPQVCAQKGMPCTASVYLWLTKHPEFAEQYARAKEIQCELLATETLKLADTVRRGKRTKKTVDVKGQESTEENTGDMVDRARLQVDTRKWLLSKMFPKKYGDRLELAGDAANPLTISIAETLRQKRAERSKKSEESAT